MTVKHHLAVAVASLLLMGSAVAQDPLETPTITVPDPIFKAENSKLAALRLWSMEKWMTVRKTNHPLYHYALNSARFRAYHNICKRHDLNVDLTLLNELALWNLSEIVIAHYEEPEWANFEGLNEDAIRTFIGDLGQDIYAFEYAVALNDLQDAKELAGSTTKAYCTSIAKENYDSYIVLRATAKRQLGR